jgi:ABC-type transport system involved in multi-copper enzyme maturation permease subunit
MVLLISLIVTLFATSKSIYEEIEDRTMLTLMSKPVGRWEVLVGKYLGIIAAGLVAVIILGTVADLCIMYRIPGDYQLRAWTMDDREIKQITDYRLMHLAGFVPSLFLAWLELSVLAAIGVALSTRFSLVVNLPAVIIFYIAGNLTRFLPTYDSTLMKSVVWLVKTVIPYLATFDLRNKTIYHVIALRDTQFWPRPGALQQDVVYPGQIWAYVGIATLYGIAYTVFALSAGMWLFKSRELGGAEG